MEANEPADSQRLLEIVASNASHSLFTTVVGLDMDLSTNVCIFSSGFFSDVPTL